MDILHPEEGKGESWNGMAGKPFLEKCSPYAYCASGKTFPGEGP
jgi:hypothetical protein